MTVIVFVLEYWLFELMSNKYILYINVLLHKMLSKFAIVSNDLRLDKLDY